jgi:hypothetical protein
MITNIIDRRKRPYRFWKVNAIVEAAWHDNSVNDADQAPSGKNDGPAYEERTSSRVARQLLPPKAAAAAGDRRVCFGLPKADIAVSG